MIPKLIHWCWVGPDVPPPFIRDCIKTWKKHMPDYEIRLWDRNSFDFNSVPWVKEAFEAKKWAYVADYIRLYALYNYGGIYLDSDVRVYKSFDSLLNDSFFTGQDINVEGKVAGPEAAIIGAEKGNTLIKECLDFYNSTHFLENGKMKIIVMPEVISPILEKWGYKKEDINQNFGKNYKIYSSEYFVNHNSQKYRSKNFAYHINANSWCFTHRGRLFEFCWKNRLLPIYYICENMLQKIRK